MRRDIGAGGTAARAVLGAVLLGVGVLDRPGWWEVGAAFVAFPALAVVSAAVVSRVAGGAFSPRRGGLAGTAVSWSGRDAAVSLGIGAFVLLAGTALTFVSPVDAPALYLYFGGSMVLAAVVGYAGCEVLALPNLLLRRRDALWCLVYSPLDRAEAGGR